jgi:dTDP-4-amino-4,6-dideoxygalactose transaminase
MKPFQPIPFNKPFLTGKETHYIYEAVQSGKISGNGMFTKKCQAFFENKYGFKKALLTTSCTDALEMAAILANISNDDEVIIPSYTFVSTALAFIRQGAKVIFVDSYDNNPNIDADKIEALITSKTKAIVPVHYAGIACDMEKIMTLAEKYNLIVIEDAAQAIDSFYTFSNGTKKALGTIGQLSAFSFHETKNIIAGEGGMLGINDEKYIDRAEIIWEKGTNRSQFFRGEINKYGWVDTGSSFLPSDVIAAFLWAQLENLDSIQEKRVLIWNQYQKFFLNYAQKIGIKTPHIPEYASNNAHMYYIVFDEAEERSRFINFLKENEVYPVFHYLSLHQSEFYINKHDGRDLPNADKFTDCLLRMPLYYDISSEDILRISNLISNYENKNTK